MRTQLALATFAVAAGFLAVPVLAQTSGQSGSSMPGMSGAAPSKPGEQAQGIGGCPCCKGMMSSMMQQQPKQAQ